MSDLDLVRDDEPPGTSPTTCATAFQSRKERIPETDNLHRTPCPSADGGMGTRESWMSRTGSFVSESDWSSWSWQMKNRIRTVSALAEIFQEIDDVQAVESASGKFPLAITPYYTTLIRRPDMSDPVFRMAVPADMELVDPPFLMADPLEEDHDMPVPGLVHRYPDRALLVVTSTCAMYCRHCTRKRVAGCRETVMSKAALEQAVAYLHDHPEIHDVIISGGDPFTMTTAHLERFLSAVRSVPTVDVIRIGTRTPVTMPMRITDELLSMLRKYQPIWVNTHFNHPDELTDDAAVACGRIVEAGIPMGNQTVLLAGVNDDPVVMETLVRKLVKNRVRPYYLFQCDLVRGVEHFRTPLSRGIQIMEYLRGRVSGFAIPTFVVDAPGGGGKIPVLPTYVVSMSPTHTVLRNFEGMLVAYPEPVHQPVAARTEDGVSGVYPLTTGALPFIRPADSDRLARRSGHKHVDGEFPGEAPTC